MFAFANLNTKTGWSELRYPLIFNKDEDFKMSNYMTLKSVIHIQVKIVVSLGQYDSIMFPLILSIKSHTMPKAVT